tara:strand:+ start:246 stop:587 length:342 start_codon:yes stop_codon:yes gene_type:complete
MKKPIHELMGFEINSDYQFLVVGTYCWGTGDTIEEAIKNAFAFGRVKRCYCKIVPKKKGTWYINDFNSGIHIESKNGWKFKEDKIFMQTWDKHFHIAGNSKGKITAYGFDLFA